MAIDAVIFDWGGTLTPWKTPDGSAWWRIAARLVPADRVEQVGAALAAAEEEIWHRSRVEHRSGNLAEVFDPAGVTEHDLAHAVHDEEATALRLRRRPPVRRNLRRPPGRHAGGAPAAQRDPRGPRWTYCG